MPTLREQLDARQPVCQLARALLWAIFEEAFADILPCLALNSTLREKRLFHRGWPAPRKLIQAL